LDIPDSRSRMYRAGRKAWDCKSEYDRIQALAIAFEDVDDGKRMMKVRMAETGTVG